MAEIQPFRGLRFSADAGSLERLIAPPYDVINENQRASFAGQSPHNVVHLTLPEQKEDDRSKFVKYARSAALLAEWRNEKALVPESEPAFYRYTQTFRIPYLSPEPFSRTSLIALIKTEPYEKGVVLPHEQTFPKHKEDRLRILEATRAHLECIFGLFEDPDGSIHQALGSAPAKAKLSVNTEDGVEQVLEPVTDRHVIESLQSLLQDKKIWIADGHHRYETACNFRAAIGEREGRVAEDYLMIALASMSDPGLVLLPTHRVVSSLPYGTEEVISRLEGVFDLQAMHATRVWDALRKEKGQVFGLIAPGGLGFLLRAHDQSTVKNLVGDDGSEALLALDVSVLHRVILETILEVKGLGDIQYTRDAGEAEAWVDSGAAVGFLMNPPTVDDMRTIALAGEKMPQKSTYYYPKIYSGLVLWSLNDF
jgi:uncharacterized protein (DUF1015 family)